MIKKKKRYSNAVLKRVRDVSDGKRVVPVDFITLFM